MSPEELLADTNRVLHELLELERERKEKNNQSMASLKEMQAGREKERAEEMKKALEERGVPADVAAIPEKDWEQRAEVAHSESRKNLASLTERNSVFQEELIAEMKIQSDLLRQIAEKLEA